VSFFVFEPEEFIRLDILDTLATAFPDVSVTVLDNAEDAMTPMGSDEAPCVAILSIHTAAHEVEAERIAGSVADCGIVMILDDSDGAVRRAENIISISRPFNTDRLLSAVRTLLSDRPTTPS